MKRLYNKNGQNFSEQWAPQLLPDECILRWFQGVPVYPFITEQDIIQAFDVRYLQPLLYFLARTVHAATIVEIGVADGSTTWPLLKAVSEIPNGIVHSVDPDTCGIARDLVMRSGWTSHWRFYQMTSEAFFGSATAPTAIDFAFIDGDHAVESVAQDARQILSRLTPGGYAIFHEWGQAPPYEHIRELNRCANYPMGRGRTEEEARLYSEACSHGTQRALYEVLPEFDVDVMPLDFGACGLDRYMEWTEAGALLVRKRRSGDFRL